MSELPSMAFSSGIASAQRCVLGYLEGLGNGVQGDISSYYWGFCRI